MKFKRRKQPRPSASTRRRAPASRSKRRMRANSLASFVPNVYSFMTRVDRSKLVLIEPGLIGTQFFEDLEFHDMYIPYNVSEVISEQVRRGNILGLHLYNTNFEELPSRPHPLTLIGGAVAGSNLMHLHYSRPNDPFDREKGLMYNYPGTRILMEELILGLPNSKLTHLYIEDTPIAGDILVNLIDATIGSGLRVLSLSRNHLIQKDRMAVLYHLHTNLANLTLDHVYLEGWGTPVPRDERDWDIISELIEGIPGRGPVIEMENWQDYEQPPEDYDWELYEDGPDY